VKLTVGVTLGVILIDGVVLTLNVILGVFGGVGATFIVELLFWYNLSVNGIVYVCYKY